MSRITPDLLTDTLNVITLARETALARGGQAQAERLTPVVEQLRDIAARDVKSAAPAGVLGQDEFQTLLAAAQAAPAPGAQAAPAVERSQVASAMSAGGMGEVDIARHLGLTREEVRLLLAMDESNRPGGRPSAAQVRGRYGA
jgi:hypothetical protein